MTPIDLVLNDSSKTTWIRPKYNIFSQYKTPINFLSPNARSVTYSNFFGSFHKEDSFSNPGNIPIKPPTQLYNTAINTQKVNAKTKLASKRLDEKKTRKAWLKNWNLRQQKKQTPL